MKQLLKGILLCAIVSIQIPTNAQVFNPTSGCVTDINGVCVPNTLLTALPFLRITPDARSAALGEAGIASSPDASAMHFNAAKLAFAQNEIGITASYSPWLRGLGLTDVYHSNLGGYYKLSDVQAIGFDFTFFSLGDINFTSINGDPAGAGKPREMSFSFAYVRKLTQNFSAAFTGKYVYSNLATGFEVQGLVINSAQSVAADISLNYEKEISNNILTIGMALSNLGSKISYTSSAFKDPLPSNIGIGSSYLIQLDDFNSVSFLLDANKMLVPTPIAPFIENGTSTPSENPEYDKDQNEIADYREKALFQGYFGSFADAQGGISEELSEINLSFGVEYWYDKQFAVRAGYYYEHELKGDRKYITTGLGINYNVMGLNLSYLIPTNNRRGALDNTLRFSVNFNIDELNSKEG